MGLCRPAGRGVPDLSVLTPAAPARIPEKGSRHKISRSGVNKTAPSSTASLPASRSQYAACPMDAASIQPPLGIFCLTAI